MPTVNHAETDKHRFPSPNTARPGLSRRPGGRGNPEQIEASIEDQVYIDGERLRAHLRKLNP